MHISSGPLRRATCRRVHQHVNQLVPVWSSGPAGGCRERVEAAVIASIRAADFTACRVLVDVGVTAFACATVLVGDAAAAPLMAVAGAVDPRGWRRWTAATRPLHRRK